MGRIICSVLGLLCPQPALECSSVYEVAAPGFTITTTPESGVTYVTGINLTQDAKDGLNGVYDTQLTVSYLNCREVT